MGFNWKVFNPLGVFVLSHHITLAVYMGHWKRVKLSRNEPALSHLCFADYLFLFGVATENQRINMEKSQLYFSSNVPLDTSAKLSFHFGIPISSDLGVHLAMPLLYHRVVMWNELQEHKISSKK
ncbi:hypothetical protein M9H77_29567 [Catharanthus roseus]|uniref:Uncharacterized protein n=1 Tax=Catharanthus roseus TaxID=4058 RepID=A0ACB9ZVV5_CATRO|nr:hypothetical protein M9H77_29567 [Catharanthus roseus]